VSKYPDRPNKALIVIDVQNDVVVNAWRRDEIVANINTVVSKARGAKISVIWVQHSDDNLSIDSDGWQIVPELVPLASEPIIRKLYRSSFEETDLEETLAKLQVGHLFISGAECKYHEIWDAGKIRVHSFIGRTFLLAIVRGPAP
jgi:nicotinamidase-related amidase